MGMVQRLCGRLQRVRGKVVRFVSRKIDQIARRRRGLLRQAESRVYLGLGLLVALNAESFRYSGRMVIC